MIPQEIVEFINTSGQAVSFGTSGKDLQPLVGRAFAVKTNKDNSISFICPRKLWNSHAENLEANPCLSVCLTYPPTHRSVQLKGQMSAVVKNSGLEYAESNMNTFHDILKAFYGEEPAKHFMRYHVEDVVEVSMTVNEVFDQTPGPGAGKKVYPLQ